MNTKPNLSVVSLFSALLLLFNETALPQAPPPLTSQPTTNPPTETAPANNLSQRRASPPAQLPNSAGQYWEEYDIKPYTKDLTSIDRPQQAVVDWILRETGTDPWFTEPFGFINADRNTIRVYHNEQMHQLVRGVQEKFVNGTTTPQLYGLRLMAIGNPNWRTRAMPLMRSVPTQSPGVNAFLVSKENNAILLSLMRGRTDFKELNAVDVVVHNGQSQSIEQVRGRNYVRDFRPVEGTYPPYMPETGEIKEGYRLQISPLLGVDKQTVDLVIKCNIDQVERLANVNLDLPLATGQVYSAQINVPQIASWRLHERFRWPADQVLVLSCGVVAAPQGSSSGSLFGQGTSLIGLDKILSSSGDRADALLMIEYRGEAAGRVANVPGNLTPIQTSSNPLSRGRY